MDLRRGHGVAAQHPGVARLPPARPAGRAHRSRLALDNDAKALALAEGWTGAARGRRDFLAMVVSTGVGGGIVVDGRLLDGASGNAGHIGHVIVEPDGRLCACGARGCLEAEASGTAIAADHRRPPAEAPPEVVARTGAGRAGRGLGGEPARHRAHRGGRVGGARVRRPVLRRRQRRAACPGPAVVHRRRRASSPSGLGRPAALSSAPGALGWRAADGARCRPRDADVGARWRARADVGAGDDGVVVAALVLRPWLWPAAVGRGRCAWPGRAGGTGGRRCRCPTRRCGGSAWRRPTAGPVTRCPSAPTCVSFSAGAAPWAAGAAADAVRAGANGVAGGGVASSVMLAREAGASGASRALVLNATFEPLGLVSTRRALLLVLATKAELVHATERIFRSERRAFPEPSVVRLARYVRVPHDRHGGGQPAHRLRPRRPPLPVLRPGGREHRPRHAPQPRRPARLGQRRGRLPPVQHPQGGPAARTRWGSSCAPSRAAPRQRVWLLAMSGGARDEWAPYLGEQSLTA